MKDDITPEELDRLFPGRREEAERMNLNPKLRDYFVPLPKEGESFTKEQLDALFPPERRERFIRDLLQLIEREKDNDAAEDTAYESGQASDAQAAEELIMRTPSDDDSDAYIRPVTEIVIDLATSAGLRKPFDDPFGPIVVQQNRMMDAGFNAFDNAFKQGMTLEHAKAFALGAMEDVK